MKEIYILLNNVRSAFNVGSIFRTSDAIGVKKIFLSGYTPYPPDIKLDKTALGALDYVDWEYNKDIYFVLDKLKRDGIPIYSVEQTDRSEIYTSVNYPSKLCIAMGNEISGIEREILDSSERIVEIPMYGKKNSLNVSVAFGIIAYHIKNF